MSKIIFIVGPTATGKTDLAFNLAKKIKAEVISCDSMLVYKQPQIIISKPPSFMLRGVKHHFIDIISVEQTYDVFTYCKEATKLIRELISRNIPVIVCGGTGMYIKALLDGIFQGPSSDTALRQVLSNEAVVYGKEHLYKRLREFDPETAKKISPNDIRRVIRALEVYSIAGVPISEKQKENKGLWDVFSIRMFGLTMERQFLYEKINQRTEKMFRKGVVKEVEKLLDFNLSLTAQKIIGIEDISLFLEGKCALEEAKKAMSRHTRNFAKHQVTWFKKDKRIEWINVENKTTEELVESILEADIRGSKRKYPR